MEPITRSPHIAIFAAHLNAGGAERMLVTVANALAERGRQVDVVLARAWGSYLSEVSPGVRVVDLNAGRLRSSVGPLRRYLRQSKPQVLLSSLTLTNSVAALATIGLRSMPRLVLREATVPSVAKRRYARKVRAAYALAPMLFRRAQAVLAVSEGVGEELRELVGIREDAIAVVHDPTRPLNIDRDAAPPHPWLKASANRTPVVLSVGRLAPIKGVDRLLRALAAASTLSDTKCLILGDGPEEAALRCLAAELGLTDRVEFVGRVAEPRDWMVHADATVVSSHAEAFPGVILESLQVGTPVVSVNCPHGPSEILASGKFGVLAESGEPQALGAAISRSLNMRHDSELLRSRAAEFSLEQVILRWEEALWPMRAGSSRL